MHSLIYIWTTNDEQVHWICLHYTMNFNVLQELCKRKQDAALCGNYFPLLSFHLWLKGMCNIIVVKLLGLTTIMLLTDKLVWTKNIYDLSYIMLEHSRVRYPNRLLEILYVNALNFLLRSSVIYICIWANLLVHITFYINEDLSLFYW